MDTFIIESGKIQVTDPCYDLNVWCAATIDNARNGKYHSFVTRINAGVWGNKISALTIIHEDFLTKQKRLRYRWIDASIGVDSGQAGFFDYNKLNNIKIHEQLDNEFYNEVCELTSESDNFGCVEFGVVSSSGYGDGSYSLWTAEHNGETVAAKIVYIDEDNR